MLKRRGNYLHFKGPSKAYIAQCDREVADPNSKYWKGRQYVALTKLWKLIGKEAYEAWVDSLSERYDNASTCTIKEWHDAAQAEITKIQGEK